MNHCKLLAFALIFCSFCVSCHHCFAEPTNKTWPFLLVDSHQRFSTDNCERILRFTLTPKCSPEKLPAYLICLKAYEFDLRAPLAKFCESDYIKGQAIPFPWLKEFIERLSTKRWSEYRSCSLTTSQVGLDDKLELHFYLPDNPQDGSSADGLEIFLIKLYKIAITFIGGFYVCVIIFLFIVLMKEKFDLRRNRLKKSSNQTKKGDEESKVISTVYQPPAIKERAANAVLTESVRLDFSEPELERIYVTFAEEKEPIKIRQLPDRPKEACSQLAVDVDPVYANLDNCKEVVDSDDVNESSSESNDFSEKANNLPNQSN